MNLTEFIQRLQTHEKKYPDARVQLGEGPSGAAITEIQVIDDKFDEPPIIRFHAEIPF